MGFLLFSGSADENLLSSHGGDDGPVVAPLPAELFAGPINNGGSHAFENGHSSVDTCQDACAIEEKALELLMDEFAQLKSAVDGHMQKMRAFATALKDIDVVVDNSAKVRRFRVHLCELSSLILFWK